MNEFLWYIIGVFTIPIIYLLFIGLYYIFDFFGNYKEFREWKKNKN